MSSKALPHVLVLLASYNGERWIREQLATILNQYSVEVTVCIRDDGSTDSTARIVRAELSKDNRIKLLDDSARTGSAAENFFALIRSTPCGPYDYVALSDQDDRWLPEKLVHATRELERTSADAYSSATIAHWPRGRQRTLTVSTRLTCNDFLFEGAGQGCTFVLSRDFYERLRRFLLTHNKLTPSIHYHDWAIYALARTWNLRWCFDNRPSVYYRQHEHNDTGARGSLPGLYRRIRLIRSGWYKSQLLAISALCRSASPENFKLIKWHNLLLDSPGPARAISLIRECVLGGRRRRIDNVVVILSSLLQWL